MEEQGVETSDETLVMLADSVSTLLERAGGVARAREARGQSLGVNREVWTELAEAGILGVMTSEDAGGLGLGLSAAGVIAREFGRALAPEPFGTVVGLTANFMERVAPTHDILGEIIEGKSIPAICWRERETPATPHKYSTEFEAGKLNGTKAWVANADGADFYLVIASNADGTGLYKVDTLADGLNVERIRQSDGSFLSNVQFLETPAEMIAEGPEVGAALEGAVADATALAASELLGVADKALELTVEFLKTREQFGRPIGVFQALQHRAVDMHMACKIAEAGISNALVKMDETSELHVRARESSRAKVRAGEASQRVTREAVQLHGAVGYTDEFDIGLYLNRALSLSAWLGDANAHRKRWLELRNS